MLQEYVIKESDVNQVTAHKEVTKQPKIVEKRGLQEGFVPP